MVSSCSDGYVGGVALDEVVHRPVAGFDEGPQGTAGVVAGADVAHQAEIAADDVKVFGVAVALATRLEGGSAPGVASRASLLPDSSVTAASREAGLQRVLLAAAWTCKYWPAMVQ